MLDEARCRQAIAEAFPSLEIRSLRYFAAGWDYELWELNGGQLFRFPLREECAAPLRVESRLLPELARHVSVAVPRPEYVSGGVASFPRPFFAYRKLAGVPLVEARPSDEALRSIAGQVGRFLRCTAFQSSARQRWVCQCTRRRDGGNTTWSSTRRYVRWSSRCYRPAKQPRWNRSGAAS